MSAKCLVVGTFWVTVLLAGEQRGEMAAFLVG